MSDLSGLPSFVDRYARETTAALTAPYLLEAMQRIVPVLLRARSEDRTIFFFGNGGSASLASHFVTDIAKVAGGTDGRGKGHRFRCLALNDNLPGLTAWANDTDYSKVFAGPLRSLAEKGDVVVAISGSGNSPNVLEGVRAAREMGLATIGLTGIGGGKLKDLVDVSVIVPSNSMQHTEDLLLVVCHMLTAYLRDEQPDVSR